MRSLLAAALLLLLTQGCLLEQRYEEDRGDLPFACRVDSDCALGRVCDRGLCVKGCRDRDDCPDGSTCADDGQCGGGPDAG